MAKTDGTMYVVTSGGDGNIRTWRHDAASNKFEHLALLEGHVRAVTCLLLCGEAHVSRFATLFPRDLVSFVLSSSVSESYLWSGSVDRTVRVWDVGTGKCIGVLSAAGGGHGHKDAVSCMELIPAAAPGSDAYIATGAGDGEVKLWKANGEFVHTVSHTSFVTALRTFQDTMGGNAAPLRRSSHWCSALTLRRLIAQASRCCWWGCWMGALWRGRARR